MEKNKKIIISALLLLLSAVLFTAGAPDAFAYDEEAETERAADAGEETAAEILGIYQKVIKIAMPLGAVAVAGSGVQMLAGDEKTAESARRRIIIIVCALFAAYFIPRMFSFGANLVRGSQWDPYDP